MTGLICLAYVAGWTAGSFGILPFPPPLTLRLSPKQRLVTTQTGTFKAATCLGALEFSRGKVPALYSGLGICEAAARRSLSFLIPLPLTLLASVFLRAMVGRAWEMECGGQCGRALSRFPVLGWSLLLYFLRPLLSLESLSAASVSFPRTPSSSPPSTQHGHGTLLSLCSCRALPGWRGLPRTSGPSWRRKLPPAGAQLAPTWSVRPSFL